MPSLPSIVLFVGLAFAGTGCVRERLVASAPAAETRAIRFLEREVPAWSRENGCFSCHNNGDAARALYTARRVDYRVAPPALATTTAWLARPARWAHNKGDPGFSDQRLANLQFSASLLAATEAGYLKDRAPLQQAARLIARDQHEDGAWHIERQNPVGSPATWGTALATFMGWQTLVRAQVPETRDSIRRAEQWLRSIQPENVPFAAVQLLVPGGDTNRVSSGEGNAALGFLRATQTSDGGWGPYRDAPPEAYDTALALLALAAVRDQHGVTEMIQRGRAFLLKIQKPDGSWPPTTRPSGGDSYAQTMSTAGWATLALLKTQPR